MAAVQQRVLNWLYSVLTSEYKDVNRTYSDVAQTLSHYSSLTPRTDVYTYENGASALLVYISGTLPASFRGNTYWFPIGLWIPHNYPREAPMVYVRPTEGMAVRAGQHVDPQGKIYHPYLVRWPEAWDRSNVLDLLAILRDVFAKEPPVIAKQKPQNNPQQNPAPPPRPPPPSSMNRPPSVSQGMTEQARPPPPPPKPNTIPQSQPRAIPTEPSTLDSGPPLPPLPPGVGRENGRHSWSQSTDRNVYQPQRSSTLRYESSPPLPVPATRHPNESHSPVSPITPPDDQYRRPQYAQQYQQSQQPPHQPVHPPAQALAPVLPPPPPHQYQQQRYTSPPHQMANPQAPMPPQPPPSIPAQQYTAQHPQWQQYPQQAHMQQAPPQPRPKPQIPDIIDAPLTLEIPVEGSNNLPAPPIPPNPEKDMLLHNIATALYSQRQHTISRTESSLPGLKAQHQAMLATLSKMHAEINALETLSSMLNSNTSILHTALHDADKVVESSQHRAPPGVDELLVAPTVVGNQLYDLLSEERSLGDALFVLGRAVERGRISPAVFTKTTRSLAREWYLKKALAKKIGKGMGLAMH